MIPVAIFQTYFVFWVMFVNSFPSLFGVSLFAYSFSQLFVGVVSLVLISQTVYGFEFLARH